jgi:hypothetical protein
MSPSIAFDGDALRRVAAVIYKEVNGKQIVEELAKLRAEFDWNPFDDDGDEYVGVWEEVKHNFQLVGNVAMSVVLVAERATISGQSLSDPQKHAACVQALDDIIRLPWYLEPFDNVALDMAVSTAVAALNSIKALQGPGTTGGGLDITEKVNATSIVKIQAARAKIAGTYKEVG